MQHVLRSTSGHLAFADWLVSIVQGHNMHCAECRTNSLLRAKRHYEWHLACIAGKSMATEADDQSPAMRATTRHAKRSDCTINSRRRRKISFYVHRLLSLPLGTHFSWLIKTWEIEDNKDWAPIDAVERLYLFATERLKLDVTYASVCGQLYDAYHKHADARENCSNAGSQQRAESQDASGHVDTPQVLCGELDLDAAVLRVMQDQLELARQGGSKEQ